ncbi:MAG: threonine--tRNA ligase [Candidatus Omnitrophota bacterium]|nr:MAG: threonine--tRNA ligase [Candidatus Omnitrophota bacterium]
MDLETLRHSCSHVLAAAVKELYPQTKLGIGPAIADGFYYDFAREKPFTPEDLSKIEKKMQQIINKDYKFKKEVLTKAEARKLFKKLREPFKLELIQDITEKEVSVYRSGKFVDLCRGPHVASCGEIKFFKLLSVAGAYWRGNENNPMLQRIYGSCFFTKKELDTYLHLKEEGKKRDHRILGPRLGFFSFPEGIGPGLILYHPKGAMLRTIIEDYEKKEHLKRGYQLAIGPHILKSDIWVRSGHYAYYKKSMYIFKIEGQEYAIKPMNCPGHMLIYKSTTRSWRDLPIRYFELGTVYRHEKSGVLHGLLRARGFTQDDAHIFCLPEQLNEEIGAVIDFVQQALKDFGFSEFSVELSTRPHKYIGTEDDWQKATDALKQALSAKGIKYDINEGEGAFYGPKIDIKLKDALGRLWQCATIQCDFALPERFDLNYIGKDGKEYRPVMLHRVILGSLERFIGALIENYAGAMPLWLAPVQAVIIPITDKQEGFAREIEQILKDHQIRVQLDSRSELMQKRIRTAQMEKIPYMLIVGEREAAQRKLAVRTRAGGEQGIMDIDEFVKRVLKEIEQKI